MQGSYDVVEEKNIESLFFLLFLSSGLSAKSGHVVNIWSKGAVFDEEKPNNNVSVNQVYRRIEFSNCFANPLLASSFSLCAHSGQSSDSIGKKL